MNLITKIYLSLVLLTISSYFIGFLELITPYILVLLLITTFVKGQLVIDYFMGLSDVKLKYRIIPTVWLGAIISLIAISYYLPIK